MTINNIVFFSARSLPLQFRVRGTFTSPSMARRKMPKYQMMWVRFVVSLRSVLIRMIIMYIGRTVNLFTDLLVTGASGANIIVTDFNCRLLWSRIRTMLCDCSEWFSSRCVQTAHNQRFYSGLLSSFSSDLYSVPSCGSWVWCCGGRSWRSGTQGSFWPVRGWLQHCLCHQAFPHQVSHCRCTGMTTHFICSLFYLFIYRFSSVSNPAFINLELNKLKTDLFYKSQPSS